MDDAGATVMSADRLEVVTGASVSLASCSFRINIFFKTS